MNPFTAQMIGQGASGIFNSIGSYYNTKAQGYNQMTQQTAQTIPLYQEISARIREQMNQQGNAYLQSGVDVSQGTAIYVIEHKQQQGVEKINEISRNLDNQLNNIKKLSTQNAKANLINGLFQTANQVGGTMLNKYLYDNMNNSPKETTLFEDSNTLNKQKQKRYVLYDDSTKQRKYEGRWIKY